MQRNPLQRPDPSQPEDLVDDGLGSFVLMNIVDDRAILFLQILEPYRLYLVEKIRAEAKQPYPDLQLKEMAEEALASRDDIAIRSENSDFNILMKKLGVIERFSQILNQEKSVDEKISAFKTAMMSQEPHYKDILKRKRNVLDFFHTTKGETLVAALEAQLVMTRIIPVPSPVHPQPMAAAPPEAKGVAQEVIESREKGNKESKLRRDSLPRAPLASSESLSDKIKRLSAEYRAKLQGEEQYTLSDEIMRTLSADEVDNLDPFIRTLVLQRTSEVQAVRMNCFTGNKVKSAHHEALRENKAVVSQLVLRDDFATLDCNDPDTCGLFSQLFLPPQHALDATLILKLLQKRQKDLTQSVNFALLNDALLAAALLHYDATTPEDIEQIPIEVIKGVLTTQKIEDAGILKLYQAEKFDNLLIESPDIMTKLIAVGRKKASICGELFSAKHIAWSEANLSADQVAMLASGFAPSIFSNWRLICKLERQSFSEKELSIMFDAVMAGKLPDLFRSGEREHQAKKELVLDNMRAKLQMFCMSGEMFSANFKLVKNLFLKAESRNRLLSFMSPPLLDVLLSDEDCLTEFFIPSNRGENGVIQTLFSSAMRLLPLDKKAYARYIVEVTDKNLHRAYTLEEIKTLLMHADEKITAFVLAQKLAAQQHEKDVDILFANPYFARTVISVEVIHPFKFFDMLIAQDEKTLAFTDALLQLPLSNTMEVYIKKVTPLIEGHIAATVITRRLNGLVGIRVHRHPSLPLIEPVTSPRYIKKNILLLNADHSFMDLMSLAIEQPDKRLQYLCAAYFRSDIGNKKIRPVDTVIEIGLIEKKLKIEKTRTDRLKPEEKRVIEARKKLLKNEGKAPARTLIGEYLVTACINAKEWDLLEMVLGDTRDIFESGVKIGITITSRTRINYVEAVMKAFWKALKSTDALTIFDLFSRPSIQLLLPGEENFKNSVGEIERVLYQMKVEDLAESSRMVLDKYIVKANDRMQLIERLLSRPGLMAESILVNSPALLNWIVDTAVACEKYEPAMLRDTVIKMLKLNNNRFTIDSILDSAQFLRIFEKNGMLLMPFIKTPEQAIKVFVYFNRFAGVFKREELQVLKKIVESLPSSSRLVEIFNLDAIVHQVGSVVTPLPAAPIPKSVAKSDEPAPDPDPVEDKVTEEAEDRLPSRQVAQPSKLTVSSSLQPAKLPPPPPPGPKISLKPAANPVPKVEGKDALMAAIRQKALEKERRANSSEPQSAKPIPKAASPRPLTGQEALMAAIREKAVLKETNSKTAEAKLSLRESGQLKQVMDTSTSGSSTLAMSQRLNPAKMASAPSKPTSRQTTTSLGIDDLRPEFRAYVQKWLLAEIYECKNKNQVPARPTLDQEILDAFQALISVEIPKEGLDLKLSAAKYQSDRGKFKTIAEQNSPFQTLCSLIGVDIDSHIGIDLFFKCIDVRKKYFAKTLSANTLKLISGDPKLTTSSAHAVGSELTTSIKGLNAPSAVIAPPPPPLPSLASSLQSVLTPEPKKQIMTYKHASKFTVDGTDYVMDQGIFTQMTGLMGAKLDDSHLAALRRVIVCSAGGSDSYEAELSAFEALLKRFSPVSLNTTDILASAFAKFRPNLRPADEDEEEEELTTEEKVDWDVEDKPKPNVKPVVVEKPKNDPVENIMQAVKAAYPAKMTITKSM